MLKILKMKKINPYLIILFISVIIYSCNESSKKIKSENLGEISKLEDSLQKYLDFSKTSTSAIHYPNNDMNYFDKFYFSLDSAKSQNKVIRVLHYGDSQIESDRITGYLRQEFQALFGGQGVGLIPAMQIIPSMSIKQNFKGSMKRFAIWGPDKFRAKNSKYGLMAQFIQVSNSTEISLLTNEQAYENAKEFTKVSIIFGNNQGAFKAKLFVDNQMVGEDAVKENINGTKIFTWMLKQPTQKAKIELQGNADIYAIALDGTNGVAIDNNPMRGYSGTYFTKIDSTLLTEQLKIMNVEMIIMQYGGNVMPGMQNTKIAELYAKKIGNQIKFLKNANPNAVILFIGPSDMAKKKNGKMQTMPLLKETNQLLKENVLANNAAFWNMFEAMGGENSMEKWVNSKPSLASPDHIHFSHKGAKKIAEMIFEAITNDYNAYTLRTKINELKNEK